MTDQAELMCPECGLCEECRCDELTALRREVEELKEERRGLRKAQKSLAGSYNELSADNTRLREELEVGKIASGALFDQFCETQKERDRLRGALEESDKRHKEATKAYGEWMLCGDCDISGKGQFLCGKHGRDAVRLWGAMCQDYSARTTLTPTTPECDSGQQA